MNNNTQATDPVATNSGINKLATAAQMNNKPAQTAALSTILKTETSPAPTKYHHPFLDADASFASSTNVSTFNMNNGNVSVPMPPTYVATAGPGVGGVPPPAPSNNASFVNHGTYTTQVAPAPNHVANNVNNGQNQNNGSHSANPSSSVTSSMFTTKEISNYPTETRVVTDSVLLSNHEVNFPGDQKRGYSENSDVRTLAQTVGNHETPPNKRKKVSASSKQHQLPMFLTKTYHMIDRCDSDVALWAEDGESFVVKNVEKFAQTVLPQYFKHSNFSSFARQLNFYGFRKLKAEPILTADYDARTASYVRFYHENFQRNKPELLVNIKRATKSDVQSKDDIDQLRHEVMESASKMDNMQVDFDHKLTEITFEMNSKIAALHGKIAELTKQQQPQQQLVQSYVMQPQVQQVQQQQQTRVQSYVMQPQQQPMQQVQMQQVQPEHQQHQPIHQQPQVQQVQQQPIQQQIQHGKIDGLLAAGRYIKSPAITSGEVHNANPPSNMMLPPAQK